MKQISALGKILYRAVLLLFIGIILPTQSAICQSLPVGKFVQIHSLEEITEEGKYLLVTQIDTTSFCLTNQIKKDKNKLQAQKVFNVSETLPIPNIHCVWKIQTYKNGKIIVSEENDFAIYRKGTNNFELKQKQAGTPAVFNIIQSGKKFAFTLQSDTQYGLYKAPYDPLYGFYKQDGDYDNLFIYKYQQESEPITPQQISSQPFVFSLNNHALAYQQGATSSYVNLTNYYLKNGQTAYDENYTIWHLTDTGRLQNQNGDDLLSSQSQTQWQSLQDIPIVSFDNGNHWNVMAYLRTDSTQISIQPLDSFDLIRYQWFHATPVAEAPQLVSNDNGYLALQGGWCKQHLLALKLDKQTREVDLSMALLPSKLPNLYSETSPNTLFYLLAKDTLAIDEQQINLVCLDGDKAYAIRDIRLTDKYPYYFSRPFEVKAGQMQYERILTDENWNTLVLPFQVSQFDANCIVVAFDGVEDNYVSFAPTQLIETYQLYLIRGNYVTKSYKCLFTSQAQTIPPTPTAYGWLATQETYSLPTASSQYVLNDAGTQFVIPATGSFLYPFRGYLTIEGQELKSRTITILSAPSTGLTTMKATPISDNRCYRIDGMPLDKIPQHGFYIKNGRVHKSSQSR